MDAVRIRSARPTDAVVIGAVHVRAWQAAYRGVMPDAYLDTLDEAERAATWSEILASPGPGTVVAAEVNGVVVGFAAFGHDRDDSSDAELYAVNVDPASWGCGAGRALVGAATTGLAAAAYREAVLWVVPANVRARRLYESLGWRDDGVRRTEDVMGVVVEELRYRTSLVRPASDAGLGR